MDRLELNFSDRVVTSFTMRVPCTFSPTGEHYVTLFAGKTKVVPYHEPHLYLMDVTCECQSVPAEQLKGMVELARLGGQTEMCSTIVDGIKNIFKNFKLININSYNSNIKQWLKENNVPLDFKPFIERLIEAGNSKKTYTPSHTPPEFSKIAAGRLEQYINHSLFNGDHSGFVYTWVPDKEAYALCNEIGKPIAWRRGGKWYVLEGWYTSQHFTYWGRHFVTRGIRYYCPVCNQEFEAGGSSYNRTTHDASQSEKHQAMALKKVKLLLAGSKRLTKIEIAERVPRKISHLPHIITVPYNDYVERFGFERV